MWYHYHFYTSTLNQKHGGINPGFPFYLLGTETCVCETGEASRVTDVPGRAGHGPWCGVSAGQTQPRKVWPRSATAAFFPTALIIHKCFWAPSIAFAETLRAACHFLTPCLFSVPEDTCRSSEGMQSCLPRWLLCLEKIPTMTIVPWAVPQMLPSTTRSFQNLKPSRECFTKEPG